MNFQKNLDSITHPPNWAISFFYLFTRNFINFLLPCQASDICWLLLINAQVTLRLISSHWPSGPFNHPSIPPSAANLWSTCGEQVRVVSKVYPSCLGAKVGLGTARRACTGSPQVGIEIATFLLWGDSAVNATTRWGWMRQRHNSVNKTLWGVESELAAQ